MSQGPCANYADTVTVEQIQKVVEKETWDEFLKWVVENHETVTAFASCIRHGEYDINDESQEDPYQDLRKEFYTKTGLDLELQYHNNDDEGGPHDEVEGSFWIIWNAYHLTPDAKAFTDNYGSIERKFYVVQT